MYQLVQMLWRSLEYAKNGAMLFMLDAMFLRASVGDIKGIYNDFSI